MKKILNTQFLLSVCLLVLITCNFATAQNQMAVAFYNVENLFDTINDPKKFDEEFTPNGNYRYTDKIYQKKLNNIAQVISKLANDNESKITIKKGPAIIGLAEVENKKVLKDLINQPVLKSRKYKIVHYESNDSRGIDVALLYRPDVFTPFASRLVPVRFNYQNKKGHNREILLVSGTIQQDTFHILVNHWNSRRGNQTETMLKRNQSAIACKRLADSICTKNPNAAVIVMGDLNDNPTDKSVTQYLSAKSNIHQMEQKDFYNPFYNLFKSGRGTCGHNRDWHLFDQILLCYSLTNNRPKSWQYSNVEIFNRSFNRNQFGKYKNFPYRSFSGQQFIDGYSDHFPVIIYLKR